MPYYAAGDYKTYGYHGDPGFLSGLWRGIKNVGRLLITPKVPAPPPPMSTPQSFPGVGAGTSLARIPRLRLPPPKPPRAPPGRGGGAPGFLAGAAVGSVTAKEVPMENGCCPSGYHPAKDGTARCVRNRRMNVTNPRALRKAMRRIDGFGRLARRMGYVKKRAPARRK